MHIQRTRSIAAPPTTVIALLHDLNEIARWAPAQIQIEVGEPSGDAVPLAANIPLGPLGQRRFEGEAHLLADGLRCVATSPIALDLRWAVTEQGAHSLVTASAEADLEPMLGPVARAVPDALIDRVVGQQLDTSLDALEQSVPQAL